MLCHIHSLNLSFPIMFPHMMIICNYMTIALLAIKWSHSSHPPKSPNSIQPRPSQPLNEECHVLWGGEGVDVVRGYLAFVGAHANRYSHNQLY